MEKQSAEGYTRNEIGLARGHKETTASNRGRLPHPSFYAWDHTKRSYIFRNTLLDP